MMFDVVRRLIPFAVLLTLATPAVADDQIDLSIKNHHFIPERLEIPANTKVKLIVHNLDPTAEEFESLDLNREKIVPAGGAIPVNVGPLDPGTYTYFGDFHKDTAQGTIVVK
jgi:plastocyanin